MTNLLSSTVVIMTMVAPTNGLRVIYLYVEWENRYSEKYSAFSRMAGRHRPKVVVTAGKNAAMGNHSGHLGCRGSEPAQSTAIAEGLPCYGCSIQNFSDGRQAPCGGHCNRSTNSAKAKDRLGVFSDGREAPPGGRCNRRAKRRTGKTFRATRMSRERTCPAAHTAKGLALPRLFHSGYSLAEPKRAKLDNSDGRQAPCGGRCNRSTKFCHGKMRGRPRRVSLDVRDWRLMLQSRHEGVAAQRLAALSLGKNGAGAEVRPGVNLVVGDNEAVAFFDAADNLRDSAVVAPQVAEFFIGEDERVRHFILFHCFGF